MRILALCATASLVAIVGSSVIPPPTVEITPSMPGPVESFNLIMHLIEVGDTNAALSLTYSEAVRDREQITKQFNQFHTRMSDSSHRLIALGHESKGGIALVHVWDRAPDATFFDIDPAFLAQEGHVWKLLPVFGSPRGELEYLSTDQQVQFSDLLRAYKRESSKLPSKYAALLAERHDP